MYYLEQIKKLLYKYILKPKVHTVRLRGRLKGANQSFADKHGSLYITQKSDLKKKLVSLKDGERILEIGFGDGEHLVLLSEDNQNKKILGVELYELGLVLAAKKIYKQNIKNTHLFQVDARDFLEKVSADFFSEIYILFPDPWRKRRHNNRRLVKKVFIETVLEKLEKKGKLVISTDWAEYGEEIKSDLIEISESSKDIEMEEVFIENKNILKEVISVGDSTESNRKVSRILSTAFAKRAAREERNVQIFTLFKK
jgi:tRNA (guanine-N7-)-methyltransferase